MKPIRVFQSWAVALATVGFCLPQVAFAAPQSQGSVVTDVALQNGGVLLGQVLNTSGAPQKDVPVSIRTGKQELGIAKTDANGYFAFSGLRGGTYQVVAADGLGAFRAWAPGTAPSGSQQGALLVAGRDLARGQFGCGPCGPPCWATLAVPAAIAAAIAIPVTIITADDNDDQRPVTPSAVIE